MKKNNKLNIAIIGLGNIGGYLYKYLETNKKIFNFILKYLSKRKVF